MEFQFTGPVIIGSEQDTIDVIYDTGSDWLAVDTDVCASCFDPVFNSADSTSFVNTTTPHNLLYGSAELDGHLVSDHTYLSHPDLGVDDFPFIAVWQQVGISEDFDGILGLSRQQSGEYENGDLFVQYAKDSGAITKEMVSFYMDNASGNNYADFGPYTLESVKGNSEDNIAWLNMPDESLFWYSSAVQAVQIGENEQTTSKRTAGYFYGPGNDLPAIFDTGTSLIYAPEGLGYELQRRIVGKDDHSYDPYSGMMITYCEDSSNYEDIYLWIDDHRFQISVEDYVFKFNDIAITPSSDYEGICILSIIDTYGAGYWLLGDAFLKGYYTIHDNDDHANARMGFAPHAQSSKSLVENLPKPTTDVMDIIWELNWIGIGINPSGINFIGKMLAKLWTFLFGLYPLSAY